MRLRDVQLSTLSMVGACLPKMLSNPRIDTDRIMQDF
jgi:hypothetical protein